VGDALKEEQTAVRGGHGGRRRPEGAAWHVGVTRGNTLGPPDVRRRAGTGRARLRPGTGALGRPWRGRSYCRRRSGGGDGAGGGGDGAGAAGERR
jgi:hypothetical protein